MCCAFCGGEFNDDEAARACGGCLLKGGCREVRCPRCGYHNLPEPGWVRNLREKGKERRWPWMREARKA